MAETAFSQHKTSRLMIYEFLNSLGGLVLLFTGAFIKDDLLLVLSGLTLFIIALIYFADHYKLFQYLSLSCYCLGVKTVITAFLLLYFSIMTENFITGFCGVVLLLFGSSYLFSKDENQSTGEQSVEAENISGVVLAAAGFIVILMAEMPIGYFGFLILFTGEGLITEYSPPTGTITESSRFLPGYLYGLAGSIMVILGIANLLLFFDVKAVFVLVLGLLFAMTGFYLIRTSSGSKKLPPVENIKEELEETGD
ncbi:MAG: hypothetical protein ACFFD4_05340 [Candidatus Odinarchaeota archaeon]